jgi:adenylylsulfate kinase
MYAKARAGEIKNFTGIDDPYEAPVEPDLRVPTHEQTVEESVNFVLAWLEENQFIPAAVIS